MLKSIIAFLSRLLPGVSAPMAVSASVVLQSGYDADKPIQRDQDRLLSDHFGLFELTKTSNADLQSMNRSLSDMQVQKLTKLARHAEAIREICGAAVLVHSGYRSAALNGATLGSSDTSQHTRCEALDFDVIGQSVDDSFTKLYNSAKAGRFQFGQLILEEANRGYVLSRWVHCSIIGSLDPAKVGQAMKMTAGPDGVPHYALVEQLKFEKLTV